MDPMRGVSSGRRGVSPPKQQPAQQPDPSPEQLLDAFKAAAMTVTKLYKISASVETRGRAEGYQDCLDGLLAFLDKENIGIGDGEGWKVRQWATERLNGRESAPQESDDEVDKTEPASSPELTRTAKSEPVARTEGAPPPIVTPIVEEHRIVVPTQDVFTFQSSQPYPQLERLDLSDSARSFEPPISSHNPATTPSSRQSERGHPASGRPGHRGNQNSRAVGQKRKLVNLDELWDLGSLGKDPFGNGSKRGRHT